MKTVDIYCTEMFSITSIKVTWTGTYFGPTIKDNVSYYSNLISWSIIFSMV